MEWAPERVGVPGNDIFNVLATSGHRENIPSIRVHHFQSLGHVSAYSVGSVIAAILSLLIITDSLRITETWFVPNICNRAQDEVVCLLF